MLFASLSAEEDVVLAVVCCNACVIPRRNSERIRSFFIFPRRKNESSKTASPNCHVLNPGEDGVRKASLEGRIDVCIVVQ